ncbi:MAG TPA: protease HtpX [Gammaproteobacteria bacterium]|nr:protease HtpX [Gammaproteobacteria bacterium]
MKRVLLFLLTNLAVLVVLGAVLQLIGVDRLLADSGIALNWVALLVFAAVFGMGGAFISLALSKWMARMSTGAQVIEHPTTPEQIWLVSTVKRLAHQAGVGTPDVAVYESPVMNAFATGARRDHALVAVSTGLLNDMSQDEVEAVLGHEISHVANGDMVTLTLIQGVINTFVIFAARVVGYVVDQAILRSERDSGLGYFATVIVAEIVFGILASLVVLWFSRQREFRADRGGASLAGKEKMIAALQTLGRTYGHSELPKQIAAFGISGRAGGGIKRLFMSHPPIEDRIAALKTSV